MKLVRSALIISLFSIVLTACGRPVEQLSQATDNVVIATDKYDTGEPASREEGDLNGDGIVDILDAAEFLANQ